jgi:DNA-binding transcriptional LysR family regulator
VTHKKLAAGASFVKSIDGIVIITVVNIAGLNLNLLVVLDALLAERHVSRAAIRLGLSQPAVSNALAQLRAHLGDPLLVRSGSRMLPTERAMAIGGRVHAALAELEGALETPSFEPARATRTFTIATSDFADFVLLPQLLARLGHEAPGIRLQMQSWSQQRIPPALESGEVDLMLGFYRGLPAGHREETLFGDGLVCVVRKGHPRVGRMLDLRTYASLSHVLVSAEAAGPGVVDAELAKHGLTRTIGLRTSHFLMVPPVVAATDFVAALSWRVAKPAAAHLPLRVLPPPLALPSGSVGQVWHERTHGSPAHAWLRGLIRAVARGVG